MKIFLNHFGRKISVFILFCCFTTSACVSLPDAISVNEIQNAKNQQKDVTYGFLAMTIFSAYSGPDVDLFTEIVIENLATQKKYSIRVEKGEERKFSKKSYLQHEALQKERNLLKTFETEDKESAWDYNIYPILFHIPVGQYKIIKTNFVIPEQAITPRCCKTTTTEQSFQKNLPEVIEIKVNSLTHLTQLFAGFKMDTQGTLAKAKYQYFAATLFHDAFWEPLIPQDMDVYFYEQEPKSLKIEFKSYSR